ncbi:MAG: pyridoxal-phosphate dependent enzyme [Pseudomonadota bacterium]
MSDIELIRAAAGRLRGHVHRTPLIRSPFLDELAGRAVWVKAECLQHTGSFKARGAWAALSALGSAAGVLAYSSGNHAQGVARAAAHHGVPSVVVMPADAPVLKIENTRALGAEVVLYDRTGDQPREEIGGYLAEERGLTLVKPYDDSQVIAGQGTCGLEIAEQAQAAGVTEADVLVCCGGGGLSSGVALALAADAPGLRVRPCEPQRYDDMARSLAAGHRLANAQAAGSICDAILTKMPGELTFPILSRLAGPGLVVSDHDCLMAMAQAFLRLKLVLEPGGAAALAAALRHRDQIDGDAVIVVATGGNVDPAVFARALQML